jgi:hypothetical protein
VTLACPSHDEVRVKTGDDVGNDIVDDVDVNGNGGIVGHNEVSGGSDFSKASFISFLSLHDLLLPLTAPLLRLIELLLEPELGIEERVGLVSTLLVLLSAARRFVMLSDSLFLQRWNGIFAIRSALVCSGVLASEPVPCELAVCEYSLMLFLSGRVSAKIFQDEKFIFFSVPFVCCLGMSWTSSLGSGYVIRMWLCTRRI